MKFTVCVLTFTIRFLTVSVNVYQNKFMTGSPARRPLGITGLLCAAQCPPRHWLQEWPLPGLVTPRTWPGLASHVQGSPAQTGRNTNSKMVRNQKSVSQNLKDPYSVFRLKARSLLASHCCMCLVCLGAAPMTQDITADKLTQSDTISTFTGSQP